jgi:hypothetical protein
MKICSTASIVRPTNIARLVLTALIPAPDLTTPLTPQATTTDPLRAMKRPAVYGLGLRAKALTQATKRKGAKTMREFEIIYKESGENDLLYGYSEKDLITRYPSIPRHTYDIVGSWYAD